MSADISRFGSRSWATWAIALWLVAGVAAPAAATPVTLYFTGPSGFGVAEGDALASGIPIERPGFIGEVTGILSGISQEPQLDSLYPFPPNTARAAGGNSITSVWEVQNVSTMDLLGETYLLFVTSVKASLDGHVVAYKDANVGLSIDPEVDLNWVLVRTAAAGGYYYPAVKLGSLLARATADPFEVHFVLKEDIQQVGNAFVLPQFQGGLGFTAIPEPATAALLGLGLVLLATLGRQRS